MSEEKIDEGRKFLEENSKKEGVITLQVDYNTKLLLMDLEINQN